MAGGTIFSKLREDIEKRKKAVKAAGGNVGKKGKRIATKAVTPKKKKKHTGVKRLGR